GYDAVNSSGSNFGPMDKKLIDRVAGDAAKIRADNPDAFRAGAVLPADAVTASGSGLDPDISPGYAALQAPRIAKARGLPPSEVEKVLADATRESTLGVLGERRVNVLEANLALDALQP
ncbi:potassium-transporting ATPase subunit C, partial [Pandoraea nosoerga]|uniref:potassium-transporting ATPase subunit C n=1 Tax=Pandoraea nosoerga TaxID=2508296 RepID=UPI00197FCB93